MPTTPAKSFSVGDFMQYDVPPGRDHQCTQIGRVCAVEHYTDDQSTRIWYYVRWISDEGLPTGEGVKCVAGELRVFEG